MNLINLKHQIFNVVKHNYEDKHSNSHSLWRILAVYLGGAWVSIEAINFFVDKYQLSGAVIDAIIILLIGGLPISIIYSLSKRKFNATSVISYLVVLGITFGAIGYNFYNPNSLNPTQLRFLKFRNDQKKIAESIRSMVILPFDNFTGNKDLEYYVAGMHSAMILDVGKISALRVISKTTSTAVNKEGKSIPALASDLGVDAVVEASVSCLGKDSVCIRVQLVSAFPEEKQLWAADYYEDKTQIQNLYNRISRKISEEINVMLTPQEENLLSGANPVNKDAYDLYLKGLFYLDQISRESLETAKKYFKLAISEDPDWGAPYAGLAEVYGYQQQMAFVSPSITKPEIYKNVNIALKLDPNSASSYHTQAVMAVWTEWDWVKGEKAFKKAIELNPNNALSHMFYSHLLMSLWRYDEAKKHFQKAVELDPLRPFILGLGSVVQNSLGNYQYAVDLSEKALSIEPNHHFASYIIEEAYYLNGEYDKSYKAMIKFFGFENDPSFADIKEITSKEEYLTKLKPFASRLEEIAQATGFVIPIAMMDYYLRLDELDLVMKWMQRGYEMHDPGQPYISQDHLEFKKINDRPDYKEILKKMNLPLRE